MKNIILQAALLSALATVSSSTLAQEAEGAKNVIRSDIGSPTRMYIPSNSTTDTSAARLDENGQPLQPKPVSFTIKTGQYQLPEGTITLADGTVLSSEQRTRLQSIIDNNMQEYLGYRVEAAAPLLPSYQSSYYYRQQFFNLPTAFAINMQANISMQPATWSGDSDTARFYFDTRTLADVVVTANLDTGKVNWSSAGWPYSGAMRTYTKTLGAGTQRVRFYGQCNRTHGSYCSAVINQAYVVINPDLPKVGETVSIQPPTREI